MQIQSETDRIKKQLEYTRREFPKSGIVRLPYDAGEEQFYIKISQIDADGSYHGPILLPVSEEVWKSRQLDKLNKMN